MHVHKLILLLFASWVCSAVAMAQTDEIPRRTVPMNWDSGVLHGGGDQLKAATEPALVDIISVPGVPWIRLHFHTSVLGKNSRLEITSLYDGATQTLNTKTMREWNDYSAYFNGDAVEIRLFVDAKDERVRLHLKEAIAGEWAAALPNKSICGPTDDRVASNDPRVGRIDPQTCTAWISSNGKHLTAGHCLDDEGNTTLSFNVPPSLADGTVQFPGPEDQYAINQGSFQFANGGVGNDWGIFTVANNSQTGLQPIAAQEDSFDIRQDRDPANIRITGFGADGGIANRTNQTHVGVNTGSTGNVMRYDADTRGFNSGSPVIDEATDWAVGIHTHGGCTVVGGNNNGTSFFNFDLWCAVNSITSLSSSDIYSIRSVDEPGKCMDIQGASTGNGALAQIYGCHGGQNQRWRFTDNGGGRYRISALHSGKCLDVKGAHTNNGRNVQQYTCHGNPNQSWQVVEAGGGEFKFVVEHSNKCLEAKDAGPFGQDDILEQRSCSDDSRQRWTLSVIESCGDGICTASESCATCSSDCGVCSYCGNGVCDTNENCSTCSTDCGLCPMEVCGNGICESQQECLTCPEDCQFRMPFQQPNTGQPTTPFEGCMILQ